MQSTKAGEGLFVYCKTGGGRSVSKGKGGKGVRLTAREGVLLQGAYQRIFLKGGCSRRFQGKGNRQAGRGVRQALAIGKRLKRKGGGGKR